MNKEVKELIEQLEEYASGGVSGLYPFEESVKALLDYINQLEQVNKSLKGNIKVIAKTSNNRHLEIKRLLKKLDKLEFKNAILEATQYCPYDKDCGKLYDCTTEEYLSMCDANVDLMAKIDQLETNRDETIKRCKYLLENNEVVINGKKYYKHSCDDIITKYILDSLEKVEE